MSKYLCSLGLVTAFLLLALPEAMLYAQESASQSTPHAPILAYIRKSVIRTIGAQESTVNVIVRGNILTVARVNSNMNESTHGGRDNEANAIAPIVAKAISGKFEFKNLTTIRVQYVIRPTSSATEKIVDTIDFRKAPSGLFEFHKT
jgi:hypothetical protein